MNEDLRNEIKFRKSLAEDISRQSAGRFPGNPEDNTASITIVDNALEEGGYIKCSKPNKKGEVTLTVIDDKGKKRKIPITDPDEAAFWTGALRGRKKK